MTTDDADTVKDSSPRAEGNALNVQDVLSGSVPEGADAGMLVACLTFETVGNSTVVRVDIGGAGHEVPLQIVALEGVTGVTLQQLLLNNEHILT